MHTALERRHIAKEFSAELLKLLTERAKGRHVHGKDEIVGERGRWGWKRSP